MTRLAGAIGLLIALAAGGAAAQSGEIEPYYPLAGDVVRWYAIKDLQTGRTVDDTSIGVVARRRTQDGRVLHVVEHRHAGGVGLDYEELGPRQLQLERVLAGRPDGTVADAVFTPPLPRLRAPLEVGRSWTAQPRGDRPSVYTVERRLALTVRGTRMPDCVRVVRARDATVDLKTDYCRGLGVARFETLRGGRWLRAELSDVTLALELLAVRAARGGCDYVFDPRGFPEGAELTVTVRGPGQPPRTFAHRARQALTVGLAPDARRGRWVVRVESTPRAARHVIHWTGACRSAFLAPPPSRAPSLTLVAQEAVAGTVRHTLIGTGWTPGEALLLTTAGAGWETQTSPLGQADAAGRSRPAVVPITESATRGDYSFTLRGAAHTATLTLVCRPAGFCAVKPWREP